MPAKLAPDLGRVDVPKSYRIVQPADREHTAVWSPGQARGHMANVNLFKCQPAVMLTCAQIPNLYLALKIPRPNRQQVPIRRESERSPDPFPVRGGLADLAAQIASTGASIKQILHDRAFASPDVSAVNVLCTVETRNHQHLAELRALLKSHGVKTYDST